MNSIGTTVLKGLGTGLTASLLSLPATASFNDNLDSYATGSNLAGQGGWKGWDGNPAFGAVTTAVQSRSAPNSVDIAGTSDLVHEFSGYTSGTWRVSAWQYIPDNFPDNMSYFILLNTYADNAAKDWSTQVRFDGIIDLVVNDYGLESLPLITGEWVEVAVVVDLDLNKQTFFYGGQQLYTSVWATPGGALNIAAMDLYANNASSVYYDDISILRVPEPGTLALLGLGFTGLAAARRRRA